MDFLLEALTNWLKEMLVTSSWQSGAAWATPYCYVLRCSKPAVSPNQSFRRTKTEGGFHIGLCTRTQGLNKSQNKGHVQSDQAVAYLLHGRSAYWRTAFLFAQKTYRKQCSGYVYDAGYSSVFPFLKMGADCCLAETIFMKCHCCFIIDSVHDYMGMTFSEHCFRLLFLSVFPVMHFFQKK